jgi:hypothetical protein
VLAYNTIHRPAGVARTVQIRLQQPFLKTIAFPPSYVHLRGAAE